MTSGLLVKTAAPINLQISDVARVTTAMSRLSRFFFISKSVFKYSNQL